MAKKLTDADVMTGFNPDPSQTDEAEDSRAREETSPPSDSTPEGDREPEVAEGSEEATPPTERDITLDGKTFRTSKDVADAFLREINRRDGTSGSELQKLRERVAFLEGSVRAADRTEKKDEVAEPSPPDPELEIDNPAEYQRQMIAYTNAMIDRKAQELTARYESERASETREETRRSAWAAHCQKLYSNPDNRVLVGNEDIVDMVLEEHREELAPMSAEEGFARLATLAKERLARLTGVAPEVKAKKTPNPPHLEGSTRRTGSTAPAEKDSTKAYSLTEEIRSRRRAAREAFSKGGSGNPAVAQPR